MSKHCIRIFGIFLASGIIAVSGEMEINLVRNGEFKPGMDKQGPKDWSPYYAPWTNIMRRGAAALHLSKMA